MSMKNRSVGESTKGQRQIKIHGDWIDIKAEVDELSMLSAHADVDEIMRWLSEFRQPHAKTFIVHGEPGGSKGLGERIERELGWERHIPIMGERIDLPAREAVEPMHGSRGMAS